MSDAVAAMGNGNYDAEKGEKTFSGTDDSNGSPERAEWETDSAPKQKWTTRFVDSFRRDPNAHVIKPGQAVDATDGHGGAGGFNHKAAAEATANSGLAHKLKARHMQMIAIGGSIGKLIFLCLKFISKNSLCHLQGSDV